MCPSRKKKISKGEVMKFTYPKLHTGKSWYVDFMSYDPGTETMRRKKYMLDGVAKVRERRKQAAELIEALTEKLRQGWSPWVDASTNRGYTPLDEALDKYSASIDRMEKYKTRKSYGSRLAILREYIAGRVFPPKYVYQFDAAFVADFLDWIYLDRECSGRTRNNYRGWCSSLAAFFIERQYISANPVEKIKNIEETPKKRQPLTEQMLRQLSEHLRRTDKMFLLACQMEYYTFIRPEELSHVKIGDISVKDQTVFIPATVSKNKRDGKVGINATIIKLMIDLGVFSHHNGCYLFGKNMQVSETRGDSEQFRRKWAKVRGVMKWGDQYQFYSLKDSGLRDLATAEGIIVARDQARHTDVSTTNKYLQGRDQPVHAATKTFEGAL